MSRVTLRTLAALGVTWTVWGTTYLAIKVALVDLPPLLLSAARFLLAGLVLYSVAGRRRRSTGREWAASTVAGGLLFLGGMGGVAVAEQDVSSGTAALMIATVPMWSILLQRLAGTRPHKAEWLAVAVGIAGAAVLALDDTIHSPMAVAILLGSALCWALGSFAGQRLAVPTGLVGTAMEMITGGVLLVAASLSTGEFSKLHRPETASMLATAYLVVFGSLIVMVAYRYLLETASIVIATSYAFVSPVIAVFSGYVLLAEPLNSTTLVVTGLVVMAVLLAGWGARRRSEASRVSIEPACHQHNLIEKEVETG